MYIYVICIKYIYIYITFIPYIYIYCIHYILYTIWLYTILYGFILYYIILFYLMIFYTQDLRPQHAFSWTQNSLVSCCSPTKAAFGDPPQSFAILEFQRVAEHSLLTLRWFVENSPANSNWVPSTLLDSVLHDGTRIYVHS